MNSIIIKTKDKKAGINYIFNDSKGVIVDISKCRKCENLMLFEVEDLCENVTKLEKKDDGYYIGNIKYASIKDTLEYLDKISNELDNDVLKGKTYLCLKHLGKYEDRYKTYEKLLNEIALKNYKIVGVPTEQYVNGSWNEKDENKYLTNIMIPIKEQYE